MNSPLRILRGVRDIRTRSTTTDRNIVPHKVYMAITVLEIEKFRRETERQTLQTRLKSLNERLRVIDAEKASLLERLGRQGSRQSGARLAPDMNRSGSRPIGGIKH